MAQNNKHQIAAALQNYANKVRKQAGEKSAAGEGAPDRMTAGDGEGGVTCSKGSYPKDVGESEVKRDQPADGSQMNAVSVPSGGPDRMTAGDGEGGVNAAKGSRPDDPGEAEVEQDQPADGMVRKAATLSKRAQNIRAALVQANPRLAAQIKESEKAASPAKPAVRPAAKPQPAPVQLDLSQDVLAKIATAILSTDDGQRFVHNTLEKQAGEAAARAQIQEAILAAESYDRTEQIKSAAFDDLAYKVDAIHGSLVQAGVTDEDAGEILKQAAFHQERIASLDHPLLKAAYVQGMDDAALMTAADDAAAGGEDGAPPVDEALPMGGESLGEEEIMQLLQEMIASGEITEEDIMAALSATEGGGAVDPDTDPAAMEEPAAVGALG